MKKLILTIIVLMQAYCTYTLAQNVPDAIPSSQKVTQANKEKINVYLGYLKHFREQNELKMVTKYLNAIAQIYWISKDYNVAIKYFDQSIKVNKRLKNYNAIAGIQNIKGMIYTDSKQYKLAVKNFRSALKYYYKKRMRKDMITTLINSSIAYGHLKDYQNEIENLEEALALAQELSDLEHIVNCSGFLSKSYAQIGDTKKSEFYFNIYKAFIETKEKSQKNALKRSLREVTLQKKLSESEKKAKELELYKKQQELSLKDKIIIEKDSTYELLAEKYSEDRIIHQLHKETIKQNNIIIAEKRRSLIIISIALIISLLFLIIIFFFFRKTTRLNKRIRNVNTELEKNNKLLTEKNKEIANQRDEIKKAADHKNRIFSIIGHDLRSPIGTIRNLISLIVENKIDDQRKRLMLNLTHKSAVSAYSLLENLLAWANNQRGNTAYNASKLNLYKIISDNVTLLSETAKAKSITITYNIETSLNVIADLNTVSTIVRNVISNAIKFCNKNNEINIAAVKKDKIVEISIKDNGIGISPENLQKILNQDIRHTSIGTDGESGSGLGLQLCFDFVKLNKGTYQLISKEGEGTNFIFTLPAG